MNTTMFTPDYSHITGLLQQLNDEELKELLNNEDKLKTIVHDLKQVHDIEAEKEMLIASNKSISEYNLSKKPVLELHRQQILETHKIALELKNCLLEKKRKIENCEKTVSKDTVLALLQTATSEVEEEAEATVEFFLKNELSVEDFLDKYLELRKLAHLRRIKAEKLASILRGNLTNHVNPPMRPQKPRVAPSPPAPQVDLPYPSQSSNSNNQKFFPHVPVRTAPPPPPVPSNAFQYPRNVYPQNQNQPPQPFSYTNVPFPSLFGPLPPPSPQHPQFR